MLFRKNKLNINNVSQYFHNIEDFKQMEIVGENNKKYKLCFLDSLVNIELLDRVVLLQILNQKDSSIKSKCGHLEYKEVNNLEVAVKEILNGCTLLCDCEIGKYLLVNVQNQVGRSITESEQETVIYGPKESFVEDIRTNLLLIRKRIKTSNLKNESFTLGSLSQTKVQLLYVEGIVNDNILQELRYKIKSVNHDMFLNNSDLTSFLDENTYSLFPQYQITDRPDIIASSLASGKLAVLMEGTPFAIIAPSSFLEFFQSPEDYIQRWPIATFFRFLRFLSFPIAFLLVPLYVGITTHNYEMLPVHILNILIVDRFDNPFPPLYEALFMIIVIEIIKDSSLRMPSKTGQTLGIIGGIVIGQVAIETGIVSKVLVIFIAISTLASFLVPNYLMTQSTKLLQIFFVFLSVLYGVLGIILGVIVLLIHLNSLESLTISYLSPLSPLNFNDWNDSIVKAPIQSLNTRPNYLNPRVKERERLVKSSDRKKT